MEFPQHDEAILKTACNVDGFMPPPHTWTFADQEVKFGGDCYMVEKSMLYELALLDIHALYWETACSDYLLRYHRGLQYHVELSFKSATATKIHQSPTFLHPWLARVT